MSIPVFVQLMSGEVLAMEFRERTGLYGLQRALMDYCYDWKPMLQTLYRLDDRGEYVRCRMYSFTPTEGERLFLVLRKQILHEQLYMVYTYDVYALYRFVYSLEPHHGPPCGFTFMVKEGKEFSLDAQQWHPMNYPDKATWFPSVEEMVGYYSNTVSPLPDETRANMVTLWEIRE
jgi:hypothetical protein